MVWLGLSYSHDLLWKKHAPGSWMHLRIRDKYTRPLPNPEPEAELPLPTHRLMKEKKTKCLLLEATEIWGLFVTQHYHSNSRLISTAQHFLRWGFKADEDSVIMGRILKVMLKILDPIPKAIEKHKMLLGRGIKWYDFYYLHWNRVICYTKWVTTSIPHHHTYTYLIPVNSFPLVLG